MKLKHIKLFEGFGVIEEAFITKNIKVLPYSEYMLTGQDSEDNIAFHLNGVESYLTSPDADWNKRDSLYGAARHTPKLMSTITGIEEEDIKALPVEDRIQLCKKLISYLKKDMILARRERKSYQREDKATDIAYKVMSDPKKVKISNDGDIDYVRKIVYELKLSSKIKKNSQIELDIRTSEGDRKNNGSIETWNILANGYITIDGHDYDVDDIVVDHRGYDHHYYDY
jgi:hypothetical protein